MDYIPLYITLGLLFSVGVLMPLVIGDFVDVDNPPENSIMNPIVDLIENGISFFTFELNIFSILGDDLQESLVNYVKTFAFIPNLILIPLIIIMIIGVGYTVIKLLPTT